MLINISPCQKSIYFLFFLFSGLLNAQRKHEIGGVWPKTPHLHSDDKSLNGEFLHELNLAKKN